MDLTLGKRADYTVRAVLDLARHHGHGRRKTADIAEEMQVPLTYLPRLLAELVRAGIVRSLAGRHGGYELVREPGEVSLLEVIEVADGTLGSAECVLRGGPCRWEQGCAIHTPWNRAQEAFRDSLRATTFAEVAAIDAALSGSHGAGAPPPPAMPR
ncbi:MAG: Rrf2 family transcriptional regulator [Nitriliruptor sp.]|nr:MAG: Rrf2 family transcriptional regulator [Nitriliruptor sp.]